MNYIKIVRRECRSRNIPTVLFLPYLIKSFNSSTYCCDIIIRNVHNCEYLTISYIKSFNVSVPKQEKALIYSGACI